MQFWHPQVKQEYNITKVLCPKIVLDSTGQLDKQYAAR